ncbi:MAG: DUF58 domain-containing protein [Acetobacteraceae bacterium]|nr:DUF58 domain-containing protein [Acetobacteraceae bacterium]
MFTRGALWACLLLALAGGLLRSAGLVLLGAGVGLLALLAWAGERYCLKGVSYSRHVPVRSVFFGEAVELKCRVTNDKPLPLPWVEVLEEVPEALLKPGETAARPCYKARRAYLEMFLSLRWFERVTRRFELAGRQRGDFRLGPARLLAGDVFGLYERAHDVPGEQRLVVYPRLVPLVWPSLPGGRPQGERGSRRWILEDPSRSAGVRDYRSGDPFRLIHWKATARAGRLQVKACEPTSSLQLMLLVNVNTTPRPWEGYHPDALELVLMLAAALARDGIDRGFQVGLAANSCLPGAGRALRLPPARDPRQLREILTALAQAMPPAVCRPEDVVLSEAHRLRWGATALLVTAYLNLPLASALTALRARGHPVAVVLVGGTPGVREASFPGNGAALETGGHARPGASEEETAPAGLGEAAASAIQAKAADPADEEATSLAAGDAALARALRGIQLLRLRREGSWRDIARLALEEVAGPGPGGSAPFGRG